MVMLDLIKATVVCGGTSFLVYTFPVVGQTLTIGILALLWLLYARQTVTNLRRH
jgi:hypothetical protein